MTFSDVEINPQSPANLTRQKRQLADQAIAQATASKKPRAFSHQKRNPTHRPRSSMASHSR